VGILRFVDRERFRGIVESYDLGAARYDEAGSAMAREWFAEPQRRFAEIVPPGGRVLDLGCGPGLEIGDLRELGLRPVGLDPSRAMLRYAAPRAGGTGVVCGTALGLPFAEGTFDGVWASASLHHLSRDEAPAGLAEVRRVLKPGGAFYCSVQRGEVEGWVRGLLTGRDTWYTYHSEAGWRELVKGADLRVQWFLAADGVESANEGATGWINVLAVAG
jgi:SAM-dependent methyltransferase